MATGIYQGNLLLKQSGKIPVAIPWFLLRKKKGETPSFDSPWLLLALLFIRNFVVVDSPRFPKKSDHAYSILSRTRADFSKPPQPIVALVPKVGSLGEHLVAVAAKPLRAWDTSVARRQKTFTAVPGKLMLCRTNAHPAVKAVGLAVAGPEYRPNNAKCGSGRGGGPFPAPRMVRRVPPNASCIAP